MDPNATQAQSGTATPPSSPQERATSPQAPAPSMQDDGVDTDKAKLQLLKDELEQSLNSVNQDFISYFLTNTTPEEQELQFSDAKAYLALYEQKKEAFLKETIDAKKGAITALEEQIRMKEETATYKAAMAEFLKEHPDVDKVKMREFFEQDVPPREQQRLSALPPAEFYEELYELYSKSNPTTPVDEPQVPIKLEGGHGVVQNSVGNERSPWKRSV